MKVLKPLVAFLVLLIVISFIVGYTLEAIVVQFSYSSTLYLLLCFGMAGHFLEEYYTKAWEIELGTWAPPHDWGFFVVFSHSIVLISFLFYFPIAARQAWAFVYGLGVALNGILNGIAHTAIAIKFRKNTGFISGIFLLVLGLGIFVSIFVPS
ncbi:MAG: hypothetical protein ACXADL_10555 [Candidatus Thorarchaeota archaeon]|jgi:hypothetical protein